MSGSEAFAGSFSTRHAGDDLRNPFNLLVDLSSFGFQSFQSHLSLGQFGLHLGYAADCSRDPEISESRIRRSPSIQPQPPQTV